MAWIIAKTAVFVLVSAGVVAFSWRWLRDPRSYGFWRFFAFEAILALMVLALDVWLVDILSVRQIAASALLAISVVLIVSGFVTLRRHGRVSGGIDATTELVTHGIYARIRHPWYSSLLFLTWGTFLKRIDVVTAALAVAATISLVMTALCDERETLARFGDVYAAYMRRTRRFIPWLF
jgi:protein-S-isoprenylcysteine O-methyltransferase Ste14